jgi:sialic acid synthase SpsE
MSKKIRVKDKLIGPGEPIFITAEIGCAHMGDFQAAKELLLGAKKAGCDGADMFFAHPKDYYYAACDEGIKAWQGQSFTLDQWKALIRYAEEIDIIFYLTPLDLTSAKIAAELGVPMINIGTDEVVNLRLLELVGSLGLPVTMHDIGTTLSELEGAIQTLNSAGCKDIILLHSTLEVEDETLESFYTTANLRVMDTYRAAFTDKGVLVGCVEHTSSKFLIYGVAAREPVLISKHIIGKHTVGAPDDEISFELSELQTMVQNTHAIEMSLGSATNCILLNKDGQMDSGSKYRRKILVAAQDIPEGKTIEKTDVVAKRAWVEGGLHPWKMLDICGAKARKNIAKDEILSFDLFKEFIVNDYKFPKTDEYREKA